MQVARLVHSTYMMDAEKRYMCKAGLTLVGHPGQCD